MKMHTYLNYGGNCAEAFRFYQQHLGGKIISTVTWNQMPDAEKHTPPGYSDKVLHIRMELGSAILMAADVPAYQPMRSAYLNLSVDSNEEAERIYSLLTEGGEIFMKMEETFFAHRFAMLRDRFGTSWMIIHEKAMPPRAN